MRRSFNLHELCGLGRLRNSIVGSYNIGVNYLTQNFTAGVFENDNEIFSQYFVPLGNADSGGDFCRNHEYFGQYYNIYRVKQVFDIPMPLSQSLGGGRTRGYHWNPDMSDIYGLWREVKYDNKTFTVDMVVQHS